MKPDNSITAEDSDCESFYSVRTDASFRERCNLLGSPDGSVFFSPETITDQAAGSYFERFATPRGEFSSLTQMSKPLTEDSFLEDSSEYTPERKQSMPIGEVIKEEERKGRLAYPFNMRKQSKQNLLGAKDSAFKNGINGPGRGESGKDMFSNSSKLLEIKGQVKDVVNYNVQVKLPLDKAHGGLYRTMKSTRKSMEDGVSSSSSTHHKATSDAQRHKEVSDSTCEASIDGVGGDDKSKQSNLPFDNTTGQTSALAYVQNESFETNLIAEGTEAAGLKLPTIPNANTHLKNGTNAIHVKKTRKVGDKLLQENCGNASNNASVRRKVPFQKSLSLELDRLEKISKNGMHKKIARDIEELSEHFLKESKFLEVNKVAKQKRAKAGSSLDKNEHLYKILVIGELGTGKTSIIKRYVHQFFSQHYRATIGVDFALKVLNWDENTVVRLQLWDIAGQERFGNMTRVYYKEAVGAFIVFDVTRAQTFDAITKWKNDLDLKVTLPDGSPVPTILLANKCDQPKEGIACNPARMDDFCRERNFAGWFETSAKENINIDDAARFLVSKILSSEKEGLLLFENHDSDKFAIDTQPKENGKCSC